MTSENASAQNGRTDGSSTVLRRVVDGIGIVSFNRPERHNAIDDATAAAWADAIGWAAASPDVRAILLRGEGRSFSSGRDTAQLGQRPDGESDYAFVRRAQRWRLQLADSPKPVIAALKGAIFGGALETALSADMRIAATDCRMGFPEVEFGIMTDTGGTPLVTILAGPSRAKYLVMTGERISAQQALAWGLVDWVVPPEELDDRALALARRLANGPPLALAMIKQVVDGVWASAVRAGIGAELLAQSALFRSDDHAEAKAAHRQARQPTFGGR